MRNKLTCPGCGAARNEVSGAPLIRDRHGPGRSTQVVLARLAHILAPISGKPEIGVCSAPLRFACATMRPGHVLNLVRIRPFTPPCRNICGGWRARARAAGWKGPA